MQLSFHELEYVIGSPSIAEEMTSQKVFRPFDEQVLLFLNALSAKLRANREYPDVATFGFWCRKAALIQEKEKYDDISERLGKGIIFHSTPSNVAVNFAFSFAAGLLAGNANIVRLPGKPFAQVGIICDAVKQLLDTDYPQLAPYICFVKYPPKKEITDAFSALCDVRVVWGGDNTIAEMRQSQIPARTTEITFADRYSIAVIHADVYLKAENKEKIINDFYNDTYYTDQNACTSPRILFWIGKEKQEAKKDFWERVHALVADKYTLTPVQAVGKLTAAYRAAAKKELSIEESEDNFVTRLNTASADSDLMDYKYNSGFYFEHDIESLNEIAPLCKNRCQTMTYLGLEKEEVEAFFETTRPRGLDRAVPMGKSMDFTLVWDGYDLIRGMSRRVKVV